MIYQTVNLDPETVKLRWREPYVTSGLNQKSVSTDPRGVVVGFKVIPNAGFTVELQADPVLGLSTANVRDMTGADKFTLTVIQAGSLFVNLAGQANSTVYLALDAQYAVGATSGAQVKVVDATELTTNLDLVLLAKVDVPASAPVLASHINMSYRLSAGDSIATESKPRLNLVNNPSFEQDAALTFPVGWLPTGTGVVAQVSTDNAHSGTKSLKMWAGVPSPLYYVRTLISPAIAGEEYRVRAWMRSSSLDPISGPGVTLMVDFFDRNDVAIGPSLQIEGIFWGGATVYEARSALVTAPVNADMASVTVVFPVGTVGTLYVDDVEFSTHSPDAIHHSRLVGGPSVIADALHSHSAGGSYGGSPNWADGTNIPLGTIESAIDAIPTALGGASGSAKIGFTPASPVDLTATRLDNAVNELDDKKASLANANLFTRTNTFTPGLSNTTAIVATGNGSGGRGIQAVAGNNADAAGHFVATGNGSGVLAYGAAYGPAIVGQAANQSIATAAARGIWGLGGNNTGPGAGANGGIGVSGDGGASTNGMGGTGVQGVGGSGGGNGGYFQGTDTGCGVAGTSGSSINAAGGIFLSTAGTTGPGVYSTGSGTGPGVKGRGGASSNSYGGEFETTAASGNGIQATATGTGHAGNFVGAALGIQVSGGVGIVASGSGGVALRIPNTNWVEFSAVKTSLRWVTPTDFTSPQTTVVYDLPTSSYQRIYRTSTANVQAFAAFELPVGATITAIWLVGYHDSSLPTATTINVKVRKHDINFSSDPNNTPSNCLVSDPVAVTKAGVNQYTESLGLSVSVSDRTANSAGSRFMVGLDWAAGGSSGSSDFVSGLVVQYDYTRISR